MMRAVTSSQMLAIEKRAGEELGLDVDHLMERAGTALFDEFRRILPAARSAVVVCGKGNNGGDGFVAARLLRENGFHVSVFHPEPIDSFAPAARRAFERLPEDVVVLPLTRKEDLQNQLARTGGVIDALFGFGLTGPITGLYGEIIDLVNEAGKPVIAADVPSGVGADTGRVEGPCVKATATVTFTCPKVGLTLHPGAAYAGRIITAGIGIPRAFVDEGSKVSLSDPTTIKSFLPRYTPTQNKWSRGGVLIAAGSAGFEGAALLATRGAMRSGAGIVGIASPRSVEPVISVGAVEAVKYLLPETEKHAIAYEAIELIEQVVGRFSATVLGPGLSRDPETMTFIRACIERIEAPLVLDADGLFAYAGEIEKLAGRAAKELVITPHAGELGRLLGVTAAEVEADRLGFARRAAVAIEGIVVLKGARTVIASADELSVNLTGNPGMATAGTGDVLAGMIGAFLAQGMNAWNAAVLGTYLHGLAGDIAAEELTPYSMLADDLSACLPKAFKKLLDD